MVGMQQFPALTPAKMQETHPGNSNWWCEASEGLTYGDVGLDQRWERCGAGSAMAKKKKKGGEKWFAARWSLRPSALVGG